ncbi:hypothetical protein AB1L42_23750 [Thalassoglobus sp. JC818]|uniref:hypothetical protein n=1 Tax=Thalassoglobus sp. JC818 TaxID=3232136 RepID=UPI003458CEFD
MVEHLEFVELLVNDTTLTPNSIRALSKEASLKLLAIDGCDVAPDDLWLLSESPSLIDLYARDLDLSESDMRKVEDCLPDKIEIHW